MTGAPGPERFPSDAQVQLDSVLEQSDQQHDAEAQQDAGVLQQEEAAVAEAVVAGVVVQHLRHLEGAESSSSLNEALDPWSAAGPTK